MRYASKAYAKVAKETGPRELEASLLLQAAAKLQAVHDSWQDVRDYGLSRVTSRAALTTPSCTIAGFGQCSSTP